MKLEQQAYEVDSYELFTKEHVHWGRVEGDGKRWGQLVRGLRMKSGGWRRKWAEKKEETQEQWRPPTGRKNSRRPLDTSKCRQGKQQTTTNTGTSGKQKEDELRKLYVESGQYRSNPYSSCLRNPLGWRFSFWVAALSLEEFPGTLVSWQSPDPSDIAASELYQPSAVFQ
jgi:hypothetical protein